MSEQNETQKQYYVVKAHVDESINSVPVGTYTWEEACKKKDELLRHYPSVTIDGIRYWQEQSKK